MTLSTSSSLPVSCAEMRGKSFKYSRASFHNLNPKVIVEETFTTQAKLRPELGFNVTHFTF